MAAQFSVGAHFASHACDFGSKGPQLVDHRVDGLFELKNLSANVNGNLAREVAARHRCCNLGDVANLPRQVARHRVHRIGEVLPGAGHPRYLSLPSELAVRADLTCNTSDLGGKDSELLNHGVDDGGRTQELAFKRSSADIQSDRLRQIPLRDGCNRASNFCRGSQQILDESIDGSFHLAPGSTGLLKAGALARLSFFTDGLTDPIEFGGHLLVCCNNIVERVGDLSFQDQPTLPAVERKSRRPASSAVSPK